MLNKKWIHLRSHNDLRKLNGDDNNNTNKTTNTTFISLMLQINYIHSLIRHSIAKQNLAVAKKFIHILYTRIRVRHWHSLCITKTTIQHRRHKIFKRKNKQINERTNKWNGNVCAPIELWYWNVVQLDCDFILYFRFPPFCLDTSQDHLGITFFFFFHWNPNIYTLTRRAYMA